MQNIKGFHIHMYFTPDQEDSARQVWDDAKTYWNKKHPERVGRFHTKPVGPHVTGSFQIWVDFAERDEALAWVTDNRCGLKAMIHKVTNDDHHDHTEAVTWYGDLGYKVLDISIFSPSVPKGQKTPSLR